MRRPEEPEMLTIRETFARLTVDNLKKLLALVHGPVPARKAELVDHLAGIMEKPEKVRALYDSLNDLMKKAVQEATHDPQGVWHRSRFEAKYGGLPAFTRPGRSQYQSTPTELQLFFSVQLVLATDLRATLLAFVPLPPPLSVAGANELPARVHRPQLDLGGYHSKPDMEEVELRVRETARAALLDARAVLRLVDAGQVKVGEKTRRPAQATVKAITAVLTDGDFYGEDDSSGDAWNQPVDHSMKAFAWPMLLQAAGLAGTAGSKLQLTPAGRKATTRPAHEVVRLVWEKWQKTALLDEFNRVDVVKGQQSRGSMTAVVPRRQAVVEGLTECPDGKWVRIEDLFRQLKAGHPFFVARDAWRLYIVDQQYGSFGYDAPSNSPMNGFTSMIFPVFSSRMRIPSLALSNRRRY